MALVDVKAVHHIGVAVRSIEAHGQYYTDVLGAEFEGEEVVADQKTKVAFFRVGAIRFELLEPTDASSPIAAFLEKRGEGLHHVALEVNDLDARVAALKDRGFRMIDDRPRRGARGLRIAFAHPKSTFGVLTEFCEPPAEER